MPKSPDEPIYSPEPPEKGEKSQRETFKGVARTQLDSLGYSILAVQLENFFNGKGAKNKLDKLLPHLFGTDDDFLNHMVSQIKRVPDSDQVRKLLAAAIFGEPAKRNEDGTIIVTSFTVAEPSSTTTQSKFPMLRGKQSDKRFKPNIKDTDKLVRNLISGAGFLKEGETAEVIFQLKKGHKITLPHPSIKSLNMNIEGPVNTGNGDTRTAYSYRIQTRIKDNQLLK